MATLPIYLLATGPLPAELIEEAAAKGIVLDTLPFIATEPVADETLGARLRDLGSRRLTAVFTSTNAVEAVKGRGRSRKRTFEGTADPRSESSAQGLEGDGSIPEAGALSEDGEANGSIPEAGAMSEGSRDAGAGVGGVASDWRIFCIGGATRRAVADYFGEAAIAGTAESATALAEVVIAEGGTKEIFFFCGDQRREELPVMLRAEGFKVNEWVVYRTMLTPQKTQRIYAGIAFFSPSAVESYFSLNTVTDGMTLFAIGGTTAAAIQARCSRPVIISDRPGKDALVRTMTDYFQMNNKE